jgi:branched-chain amino acid aminotransferase
MGVPGRLAHQNGVNGEIMADFIYYINGAFVLAREATVSAGDLGLVRGYGVFDVLRTYDRIPFALRRHLERLERSAQQVNLPLPASLDELERLVHATLARNAAVEPERDVTVRLIVTGGASAGFLLPDGNPSLLILVAPVRSVPGHHYTEGAALITADIPRFLPSVKSINYIPAILGQQRARAAGAVEALYCTAEEVISECTTANFFVVAGGKLITPNQDVLAGITRNITLELADDVMDVTLRPIRRDELRTVDEAFITSTTKEIMPIVRIDDITIGNGRPGPLTARLAALFRAYSHQSSNQYQPSPL